jgi:N6-adenosine-specific RNA methylase IME4
LPVCSKEKMKEPKKYNVIYADPPWSYKNKRTGGSMISGSMNKYPVMTLEEIKAMSIPSDKNCVLFIWATVPLMPEAIEVMKAWGFKYKTMITWRKIMSLGMGYWFRGQCEHLILGVKGNVKAFRQQKANFYESEVFEFDECYQTKVGRHSEKPHYFRGLIENAVKVSFANPVKLEMFARKRSDGWDVFGNQVEESIVIISEPKVA